MVVLVRCTDDTITVAQRVKLNLLIRDGLIKSFLRSGVWVDVTNYQAKPQRRLAPPSESRCSTFATCL